MTEKTLWIISTRHIYTCARCGKRYRKRLIGINYGDVNGLDEWFRLTGETAIEIAKRTGSGYLYWCPSCIKKLF